MSRDVRQENPYCRYTKNDEKFSLPLILALIGIFGQILVAGIVAYWGYQQETWKANREIANEVVIRLTDIQKTAEDLKYNLGNYEEYSKLVGSALAEYKKSSEQLKQELLSVVDQYDMQGKLLLARYIAEAEIYSLEACLYIESNSNPNRESLSDSLKKKIFQNLIENNKKNKSPLTEDQMKNIEEHTNIAKSGKCGEEFDAYALRMLTYQTAHILHQHIGGDIFEKSLGE